MINTNYNVSFGALKSIKCKGDFNPGKNEAQLGALRALRENANFKNLCKNYDVYVTFNANSIPLEVNSFKGYHCNAECEIKLSEINNDNSISNKLKTIFNLSNNNKVSVKQNIRANCSDYAEVEKDAEKAAKNLSKLLSEPFVFHDLEDELIRKRQNVDYELMEKLVDRNKKSEIKKEAKKLLKVDK